MKKCLTLFCAILLLLNIPSLASAYDEASSMVKISGEYGMSFGLETDEFIWKNANGDYQEHNWRYIDPDLNVNTYDPRIFDRYKLEIETDTGTPWNAYTEIVVDPWSFVGYAEEQVTVFPTTPAFRQSALIEYRYWEATGKTINQTFRTDRGYVMNTQETKVFDYSVSQQLVTPQGSGGVFTATEFTLSADRSADLDFIFRPVRKAWVEYTEDPLYIKVFPISDQSEALSSDDPLKLSNNHVYWAPSPWLFSFDPGQVFTDGSVDLAKWNWDLAWYAEDSNRQYLTFLRGATIGYDAGDVATVDFTIASPLELWGYYNEFDSLPMAGRLKLNPNGDLVVGSTYTSKFGIHDSGVKASDQTLGVDATYSIGERTDIFAEYAASRTEMVEADARHKRDTGYAVKTGLKSRLDFDDSNKLGWDLSFTYMSEDFSTALADYKDTRIDRDWGRHIWFDQLSLEDRDIKIGDSVDINRYVIGMNARARLMDNFFDIYFNFRNAHKANSSKFVENILRLETTCNPLSNVQLKGLALHRMYHDSVGGLDPFIFDRYTDEPYTNSFITDGMETDLMTFSGGAKVDFLEGKLSVYGIYEATNDPQEFPRDELNNYIDNGTLSGDDDILVNTLVPNLYSQDLFDLPPYDFYNIWKGVVAVRPVENVSLKFTHVTNGNRNYAALFDNNHNHDSVELYYSPKKDMRFNIGYSISRVIDLKRALDTNGAEREFKPYHNVFAQFDWKFKKNQRITFLYGEAWIQEEDPGMFGTRWPSTRVSALETRHIVRVFYQGKF